MTPRLSELLADRSIWTEDGERLPAIAGEDREAAEVALARYAEHPRGSSDALIEKLLGTLTTAYPAARLSAAEARSRLKVYTASLHDIDQDLLREAVANIVKTSRFFPSVSEIREEALRLPAPERVVRAWRLRQLLAVPPEPAAEELVDVAEVSALLGSLSPEDTTSGPRVPTLGYSKSLPTVEDYIALGLSEEEALEQWGKYFEMMRIPQPERPAEQKAA